MSGSSISVVQKPCAFASVVRWSANPRYTFTVSPGCAVPLNGTSRILRYVPVAGVAMVGRGPGTVRTTRTDARGTPGASASNVCSPGSRFTVRDHAPCTSAPVCPTDAPFRYTATYAFGSAVPRSWTVAASVVDPGAGDVIVTGAVPASNAPASQAGPIGRAMPR